MINVEFVKNAATSKILYVNREEDAGDLGLRKAKLSYHPVRLIEKYTVTYSSYNEDFKDKLNTKAIKCS